MKNDWIGVAVIGSGMAGRAHATGYRSATTVFGAGLPEVRLVAVADIDARVAEEVRRRYGFARAEQSWQAIAEPSDIDAVSVVVANHADGLRGIQVLEKMAASANRAAPDHAEGPGPARSTVHDPGDG